MSSEAGSRAPAAAVTVLESSVSSIEDGVLRYRGVAVEELVAEASYEDVAWFLWTGSAPTKADRTVMTAELSAGAAVPESVWAVLRTLPSQAPGIAKMQVALPLLALHVPELSEQSDLPGPRKAARLLGAFATIAGNLQQTKPAAPPEIWPGVARTFLAGARGGSPPDAMLRAFEQVLILYADHELNASTFAGRVTASTRADLMTSVLSALSALRGPLHGGVDRFVRAMLAATREEGAAAVVDRYLRADRYLPGFGHSVYRGPDPRGVLVRELAQRFAPASGQEAIVAATLAVEAEAGARGVPPPNVDLYAAAAFRVFGVPDVLSPLVFATGRMAGWCAHVLEQYERNRLIRPRAAYVGAPPRHWRELIANG